jgi:hypothetical protein
MPNTGTKTITGTGVIETAYGQEVKPPIPYEFSYEAYETFEDAARANALLSNKEHLNAINNKEKAQARSKKVAELLEAKGFKKPTLENNPDLQLKTLVQVLVAAGRSEEDATQVAKMTLGIS